MIAFSSVVRRQNLQCEHIRDQIYFPNLHSQVLKGIRSVDKHSRQYILIATNKHCEQFRNRMICPIFMKLTQNMCSNDISVVIESDGGPLTRIAKVALCNFLYMAIVKHCVNYWLI